MRNINQIQQWVDWASNNDAAEESILDMMHTLLSEIDRLELVALQLNEVGAKYQTKAEGADQWAAERDKYKAALDQLDRYFTSGNGITVERATILSKDYWQIRG